MTTPLHTPRFHRRLHVRIAVVVLVVLVLVALCLLMLSRAQQHRVDLEVTQRLNIGLARYVIDHQPRPLLNEQGQPERGLLLDMATDVMMINPALEVYVLNAAGMIVGHALDAARVQLKAVDLAPLRALLRRPDGVELPLLGDDPSNAASRNIFSVAEIPNQAGAIRGYLYIVLRGGASQGLMEGPSRSSVMRQTTLAVLLACTVAGLALLATLQILTRPLSRLTAQAQAFRGGGLTMPTPPDQSDEIELLELAVQAQQARITEQFERMERNEQARRELISNLSHDLQTPLTSIQGYAEHCLLKNQTLSADECTMALTLMLRHCARLSTRIASLFELSKLEAGRMGPRLEVFCLAELLQDVVDGYQMEARDKNVALSLSPSSRTADCVKADIALIERVFQNLIDNALRHTPSGGAIAIDVVAGTADLRVSVCDTGMGIASEHLAHVFERYYQAQDTVSMQGGPSAGLGLAIVKRILELHGSVIRVSSAVAQGTRFDFSLPRAAG